MSDELFEVAFSGQISDAADLEQVKAKIATMFKADEAKLAHLFSGKRVVIKKNIDQATANKYKTALNNAGAVCEIKSLSGVKEEIKTEAPKNEEPVEKVPEKPVAAPSVSRVAEPARRAPVSGDIPAAPQTAPLDITANDIAALSAGIAPVGSDMQDEIKQAVAPQLDLTGLDMAPAGSDLGELKKDDNPPLPDTSGMTLAD